MVDLSMNQDFDDGDKEEEEGVEEEIFIYISFTGTF